MYSLLVGKTPSFNDDALKSCIIKEQGKSAESAASYFSISCVKREAREGRGA